MSASCATITMTDPAVAAAELQAQIAAIEGQLERARLQEQVRQLEQQLQASAAALEAFNAEEEEVIEEMEEEVVAEGSGDPDGEVLEEYYDYEDESVEEIIVIEEIMDGEEGEYYDDEIIEIVEEEYYEEEDVEYEEEVEDEYEVEEEEIIEEEIVDEEPPQEQAPPKRTWQQPASRPLRQGAPPMVSLVDEPRPQSAPPPSEPPQASLSRKKWGAPKAVPAKDSAAAEAPEQKKSFLEVKSKANPAASVEAAPEQAPEQAPAADDKPKQRRWNPLSKRQPEKYKKTATEVREQEKKKTTRLAPLPFTPCQYPTVAPSEMGKETPIEKMLGPQLYRNAKLQKMSVTSAMQDQDLVCLYFGAAWRPGCKAFHQNLIDFYKLTSKDQNIEIIYVSVDKTIFEFKEIFARFPFLAMPTGTTSLKNALTKQLGITELPVFVVFEVATGNVVTVNGVEEISELASRDKQAAINLVQQWKNQTSTPLTSFKPNKKLKVGTNKGNLIWQN